MIEDPFMIKAVPKMPSEIQNDELELREIEKKAKSITAGGKGSGKFAFIKKLFNIVNLKSLFRSLNNVYQRNVAKFSQRDRERLSGES